jgi:hypothetical protein
MYKMVVYNNEGIPIQTREYFKCSTSCDQLEKAFAYYKDKKESVTITLLSPDGFTLYSITV